MTTILYGGFALHSQKVYAATDSTVNFQARLEGPGGAIAADGYYNIEFKLYNDPSAGSLLWTEDYYDANGVTTGLDNRVKVVNGYVSVALGSQTAFPTTINWDQNLYLTLNIGGTTQTATPTYDGEMSPRLGLGAVPYAFRAGKLAQFNNTTGFTSTLGILQPTVGNQTFQIQDQGAAGTYNVCVQGAASTAGGCAASTGAAGYVQNQSALQQASTSFWISGIGRADTALQAPSFDAPTAVALNIGTTNATSITLGKAGVNTFIGGSLSVGTTQSLGAITIANGAWVTSVDAAGTGTINMFQVNGQNQIQVGAALNVDGGIVLPTNGGQLTLSDLPIDSSAASGTKESYTLRVGSANALTVYGEADGSGNAQNIRVAIGSSIAPAYALDVAGDINSSTALRVGGNVVCTASGCTASGSVGSYIQNQNAGPQASSNFWISGTGTATSLQAASFDAASASTLTIGGTNATTINIGNNPAAHTIALGTGAAVQGITIGSQDTSSATVIQAGTNGITLQVASGGTFGSKINGTLVYGTSNYGETYFKPTANSTIGFEVQDAGSNAILIVDSTNNVIKTGNSTGLSVGLGGITSTGTLTLTSTTATTYVTPLGSSINTKINIPNYDPGSYSQILALGLPSTAQSTSRAITVLDARGSAHQPSIALISPDENQIFGLTWDGLNTKSAIKTTASTISLQTGQGATLTTSGVTGQAVTTLGTEGNLAGVLQFANVSNGNEVSIQAGATSADYSMQLASSIGSAGDCLSVASVSGSTQTLGYTSCGTTSGVTLQGSTPGTADTGNINVSGVVIAGSGLQAGSLDTTSAGILTIAGTNATTVNIATNGIAHTINIGTGAGIETVSIGSTSSVSSTLIQGGQYGVGFNTSNSGWYNFSLGGTSVFSINGGSGGIQFQSLSDQSGAFEVQGSSGTVFSVDTSINQVQTGAGSSLSVGSGGIYDNGGLNLTGAAVTSYVTPLGTSISTKINIPNYTIGSYGQIIALGLASSTPSTARAITIADARSSAHLPTFDILSPDEAQNFGLSWDGSNSTALVKTDTNNIALQANGMNVLTATNSSGTGLVNINGNLQAASLDTASASTLTLGGSNATAITIGKTSGNAAITVSGTTLFKPTSGNDSTTAFQIQNASSTVLFNVDTSTGTITFGSATNGVSFTAAGGLVASGTAQHTKQISLAAEYAGAVLDAASDSACSSANNGTMTSGYDGTNFLNYYKWASAASAQCYDVVVRVPVPSDFSSWGSSTPIAIKTYSSNTSTGLINLDARDSSNAAETGCSYINATPGSNSTWASMGGGCTLAGTYTANGMMTLRLRLTGGSGSDVRVAGITLSYNSKF